MTMLVWMDARINQLQVHLAVSYVVINTPKWSGTVCMYAVGWLMYKGILTHFFPFTAYILNHHKWINWSKFFSIINVLSLQVKFINEGLDPVWVSYFQQLNIYSSLSCGTLIYWILHLRHYTLDGKIYLKFCHS